MSSNNAFDAIIVGGGHNGLAAAAYLSKAGRKVLLLEKLEHPGGAAVSAQAFDGVDARLSRYSYLVSLLPQQDLSAGLGQICCRGQAVMAAAYDDRVKRVVARHGLIPVSYTHLTLPTN